MLQGFGGEEKSDSSADEGVADDGVQ